MTKPPQLGPALTANAPLTYPEASVRVSPDLNRFWQLYSTSDYETIVFGSVSDHAQPLWLSMLKGVLSPRAGTYSQFSCKDPEFTSQKPLLS